MEALLFFIYLPFLAIITMIGGLMGDLLSSLAKDLHQWIIAIASILSAYWFYKSLKISQETHTEMLEETKKQGEERKQEFNRQMEIERKQFLWEKRMEFLEKTLQEMRKMRGLTFSIILHTKGYFFIFNEEHDLSYDYECFKMIENGITKENIEAFKTQFKNDFDTLNWFDGLQTEEDKNKWFNDKVNNFLFPNIEGDDLKRAKEDFENTIKKLQKYQNELMWMYYQDIQKTNKWQNNIINEYSISTLSLNKDEDKDKLKPLNDELNEIQKKLDRSISFITQIRNKLYKMLKAIFTNKPDTYRLYSEYENSKLEFDDILLKEIEIIREGIEDTKYIIEQEEFQDYKVVNKIEEIETKFEEYMIEELKLQ